MTCRVGILGFQGCIEPHEDAFGTLGVETLRVTKPLHLEKVDRLILPGGESSTMLRFLRLSDMIEPLKAFATSQPTWGICAGAILLARTVLNPTQEALGIMPIEAHRNFYGSQLQSFTTTLSIDFLDASIEAQFIRAPLLAPITQTSGSTLRIHAVSEGHPVFFSYRSAWATSFHSELSPPYPLHEAFLAQ